MAWTWREGKRTAAPADAQKSIMMSCDSSDTSNRLCRHPSPCLDSEEAAGLTPQTRGSRLKSVC